MSCVEPNYITDLSNALVQGVIVFAFLTIFFFSYVSQTEKEEFENQVNMVVDDIYGQYKTDISNVLPKNANDRTLAKATIYGIIDSNEEYLDKTSSESRKEIDKSNADILKSSVLSVLILAMIVVGILIVLGLMGYCVPLKNFVKEGSFILIFIFLTEFLFLNVIAKNYISANPNLVRQKIAQAVIDYADNRKE